MDTIFIIGAGAIGKALAVTLSLKGQPVVLLRGRAADGPDQEETLRMVTGDGIELSAPVRVSSINHFTSLQGLIVLTNKSYGNNGLAAALAGRAGRSPLVILQNGLGVEQVFEEMGFPVIYRCVLFVTSQFNNNGAVHFKPVAPSQIGCFRDEADRSATIAALLDSSWFPFQAATDIQYVIWKKAIANCVFNSICPLLDTDNGIFHRNDRVLALAKKVIAECTQVAQAKGVVVSNEEVLESVLLISRRSDGQFISTLQDIREGRPTEIGTLNAAVVKIAAELNLRMGLPATSLLGELTTLKSEINGNSARHG